jgi:hypothetical protein
MDNADGYAIDKHIDKKPLIAVSREAVQTCGRCTRHRSQENGRCTTGQRTPGFSRRAGAIATAGGEMLADRRSRLNSGRNDAAQAAKAQADSDAAKSRADAAQNREGQSDMANSQAASAAV